MYTSPQKGPRSEICNSDARCRKHAALERSRYPIPLILLCLYLLTNNILAQYAADIYLYISPDIPVSTFTKTPTQPRLQPANENLTHDHTTLEHLGESLLDGVGSDLGGTVAIAVSIGSGHFYCAISMYKYEMGQGAYLGEMLLLFQVQE